MAERPTLLAVTGHPVLHSLSPQIHRAALAAVGLTDTFYLRLAAGSAAEALRLAREIGIRGLNVTAPFKEPIAGLVDRLDPVAERCGAVNTVLFDGRRATGYNTDPAGVKALLLAAGADPAAGPAVILGAGGAARAAACALLDAGAPRVTLLNRTSPRGDAAARSLGCEFHPLDRAADVLSEARLVVACLPPSIAAIDAGWLGPKQLVLDAAYTESATGAAARRAGCGYLSGREWLLGQAVASFALFTGRAAPVAVMRRALRRERRSGRALFLSGMMGAGKSSVGRRLASRLSRQFLDLDAEVEQRAGASVAALFADRGESAFRELEAAALRTTSGGDALIALGGGALEDRSSRELVARAGPVCWLWADPATCAARAAGGDRPLLYGADRVDRIAALLDRRLPNYAAAADLVVGTGELTAEQVAERIADEIDRA